MAEHIVRLVIDGQETATPEVEKVEESVSSLAKSVEILTSQKFKKLARQALEAGGELVQLGAQSLMAHERLVAFAGGSASAVAALTALQEGSDHTIDRMTAMRTASRMLQMGIVSSSSDLEMAGAIIGKLGDQTLSTEARTRNFTMMMANQSKRRLDTYGLSIEAVTSRQEALEAQGYSTEEAFKAAVYEEAAVALDQLGDTSGSAATKISRAAAQLETLKQHLAETAVGSGIVQDALTDLDWRSMQVQVSQLADELVNLGVLTEEQAKAQWKEVAALGATTIGLDGLIVTKREMAMQMEALQTLNTEYVQMLEAAAEGEKAVAEAVDETVEAEKRLLTVREARLIVRERADEERWAIRQEDFAYRAENLERRHQERVRKIIESGQQSAAEIAREGYQQRLNDLNAALQAEMDALLAQHQSRLDAVNAAQQAELDALAAAIAQRNFQRSLEDLARQHEDRLRSIRQSGIDSAEAAENRRFRDVMDRLNEEQQARLAALRARYGKEEDSDSKKEDLEAEHKRRMMGLYTESAREQERKRYEEALKELAYQEEEADLLEQFQEEKADAEETHQDELERIRQEAIQRQIDEENERYAAAVADAHRRQEQAAADAAARAEIEARYAAERAAIEAQNNAEREAMEGSHNAARESLAAELAAELYAIQQADIAQRLLDEEENYARQQANLERSIARAELSYEASFQRRKIAWIAHLQDLNEITAEQAARMLSMLLYPETPGHQGQPWEYQHGTDYHPGGLAIVGEAGPELLNLPRGTSVSPMSKVQGGEVGTTVNLYFGADSVRSDRDIYQIAENIERSLRLRGVRTL